MSADQARIRALQDELRRVKEQLQEERRQSALDKTAATRESHRARQEAHDQLTSQMSEIATALTNIGQEKSSCAEHVEERAAQIRETCTEQDAKLDDVLDAVRSTRDEQKTARAMLEEEKALAASKPSMSPTICCSPSSLTVVDRCGNGA
ncbi:hypothetical protein EWM64_g1007 [Hericium alpestre]|uniref:Uncharacterized protein n=1 Tax=Hericium alpestre TaxID=135208 RepID=A0A4Z0A9U2_9AGAM|nr:hypothetical protein EWM64_g1007 [Hericium alpestre]